MIYVHESYVHFDKCVRFIFMSFEVCVRGEFSHSSHRPISWSSKEAARAFGVRNRCHLLLTGSAIHHKGIEKLNKNRC